MNTLGTHPMMMMMTVALSARKFLIKILSSFKKQHFSTTVAYPLQMVACYF